MMDPTYDPRLAGEIERYHTWKVHRKQTVGEHSWQILRILVTVWHGCPSHVLQHAVTHDVGEVVGDIPYPHKRNNPQLKIMMNGLELEAHARMNRRFGLPLPPELSEFEMKVFKTAEYVEMWEFGLQEQNLGNQYAGIIVERMTEAMTTAIADLGPGSIGDRFNDYIVNRKRQECP